MTMHKGGSAATFHNVGNSVNLSNWAFLVLLLVSLLLVAYDFPVFALAVVPLAFAQNTTVGLATASGGPGEKLFIIVGNPLDGSSAWCYGGTVVALGVVSDVGSYLRAGVGTDP